MKNLPDILKELKECLESDSSIERFCVDFENIRGTFQVAIYDRFSKVSEYELENGSLILINQQEY